MKERFQYIDSLRGLAILGVIITHVASLSHPRDLVARFASFGEYGVQLFFVVSALTIFLTYEQGLKRESSPVRSFFCRRILRIVPVYWFGVVLYSSVYGLGSRGWLPGPEYWHIPMHLSLVNLLHPATPSSVVPGGWSISCEVLFYLTVPLWFRIVKSIRSALVLAVISILGGPVFVYVLRHLLSNWTSHYATILQDEFYYRSIFNQLGCFSCGIVLYFAMRDWAPFVGRFRHVGWNLALCLVALGTLAFGALLHVPVLRNHHVFAVGFALFGMALSQRRWRIVVNFATSFLGRISYSAYLLHFLVIVQVAKVLQPSKELSNRNFLNLLVISLALTIPLAYVSYRLLETPCINLGKRIIAKMERARRLDIGHIGASLNLESIGTRRT